MNETNDKPSSEALEAAWKIYKCVILKDGATVMNFANIIDVMAPRTTGSHASAGAEKGDGAAFCKAYGLNPAPATPAAAEPATEAADDVAAFNDWNNTERAATFEACWAAALAWERKQSTAREAPLRERLKEALAELEKRDELDRFSVSQNEMLTARLKEAEAKLADVTGKYNSTLTLLTEYKTAAGELLINRESAIMQLQTGEEQAVDRERAECLSLLNGTISADGVLRALQTLKQRLTQPANRSAEETRE